MFILPVKIMVHIKLLENFFKNYAAFCLSVQVKIVLSFLNLASVRAVSPKAMGAEQW